MFSLKKLDSFLQTDNRAILLEDIDDYENGYFMKFGDVVEVLDLHIDPSMSSGYSAEITHGYEHKKYFVDKDIIIPYEIWNKICDFVSKENFDRIRVGDIQ